MCCSQPARGGHHVGFISSRACALGPAVSTFERLLLLFASFRHCTRADTLGNIAECRVCQWLLRFNWLESRLFGPRGRGEAKHSSSRIRHVSV